MTNGVLPSCWGNSAWVFLHSIAYAYDPKIEKNKNNYFNFFIDLGLILPCENCKEHYKKNVDKQELFKALETKESFFKWVYDLHNKVNLQTGVPENTWPTYETIKHNYESYGSSCNELPGSCNSSKPNQKKLRVIEQFSETENNMQYIIPIIILVIALAISIFFNIKSKQKVIINKFK